MAHIETRTCSCHITAAPQVKQAVSVTQKAMRTVPSVILSTIIAFFPKCPVCWAAYMSMFGSCGLSNIPYVKWLMPVLIGFLCLHLYFILKKIGQKGLGPFILSLAGALIIICGKVFFPYLKPVIFIGMLLIIIGSLWNSFSLNQLQQYET